MSDGDTFLSAVTEFWDDDTVDIRIEELFWGLLSVETMSAEIAFTETDDVLVFGVIRIQDS